jgi:hypothetical protein
VKRKEDAKNRFQCVLNYGKCDWIKFPYWNTEMCIVIKMVQFQVVRKDIPKKVAKVYLIANNFSTV